MDNLKLLVLEEQKQSKDSRLDFRIERSKAINAIAESGAKIRHDSGGSLIVIEPAEKTERILRQLLPNARLVTLDANMKEATVGLSMDSTESLFLEALTIRTSKNYRDAKKRRKVGESPEEKELLTASCIREEY